MEIHIRDAVRRIGLHAFPNALAKASPDGRPGTRLPAMSPPFTAPPRPQLAVPPQPRVRLLGGVFGAMPGLWAWPLVLSLGFAAGVMAWMIQSQRAEEAALRAELISDALSLEAQLTGWVDGESARLKAVADVMAAGTIAPQDFGRQPLVLEGLRRFWTSVAWLDAAGGTVAQVPEGGPSSAPASQKADAPALSGMLTTRLHGGGLLTARYSAAALLRQQVPWWLARKYDIRLIDLSDEVVASTGEGARRADQSWYRKAMGPGLPQGWLELTYRDAPGRWWRSLPMAMMAGFVLLVAGASWMLRRQMQSVGRAEEGWRTEAAWRTAMEDSLAVGIRARDLEGRLIYVNKTMADMVGWQPEELVGLMPPMPYWVQTELEEGMGRHRRNMAGRAPRDGYESRWQHRDGSIVDVMVFEAPLVDAKGRQIGWMASIVNVTERRLMEERERRQLDAMAHHARLTMLGEVASTLAHELNQPLSAIVSYNTGVLNLLARHPRAEQDVKQALERMGAQAAHAGRIVKRIRDFLTRREPQREPSELRPVVDAALALLRRDIARHQVQVETDVGPELPRVMADPVLLEQVVVNIVRNACDALAECKPPRRIAIHARLADGGESVALSVRDNGPGLGAATAEQLFSPFHSTKAEGMGMGLAICRSVIELHYGRLDAANAPGGGAVFTFTLPTRDQAGAGAGSGTAAQGQDAIEETDP